ncbi:DUF4386 domain-containing protein [Mycoplasmatota bacterium]|nr:DUF4386 domain-containing protein [Mycoplasmatota bacterium]
MSLRKTTIIAGLLFIIGTIAGILSIAPAIDAPDYLFKASANANQVIIASIFQFIMAVAYVGFAFLMYPILRKFNKGLAIGFIGFRFIAGVFNIIGVIAILLLLILSQEFIKAGAPDSSYFHTLGVLLRAGRDLVNHVAMILVHSLGGLILYYIFYKTKLVPRWLSGWGLIGTVLTMLASLLVMFQFIDIITPIYIVLSLPMALLEMILAIWLIVKGFNTSVIYSGYKCGIAKL